MFKILSVLTLSIFTFTAVLDSGNLAFAHEMLFIHSDHINSSNIITDSAGNQAALYEYDPFGEV